MAGPGVPNLPLASCAPGRGWGGCGQGAPMAAFDDLETDCPSNFSKNASVDLAMCICRACFRGLDNAFAKAQLLGKVVASRLLALRLGASLHAAGLLC